MSNSNNKASSSLTAQGIIPQGEIKDGPSLFCIKQYLKKKSPCWFTNHQNRLLCAEVIDVKDSPGGSAKLIVDFIFTEINDETKHETKIKLRGNIDYHPELINTNRAIGVYQVLLN